MLIRAPAGYASVNAVLDAIQSGNPLIGLLFDRNCERFDALEFSTGARALLADRAYSTIMLSSVEGSEPILVIRRDERLYLAVSIMYDSCWWVIHFVAHDTPTGYFVPRDICEGKCRYAIKNRV